MNSDTHNRYCRPSACAGILLALLAFAGGFPLQSAAQDSTGDHAGHGHDHGAHARTDAAEEAPRVEVTREQVERFKIKIAVAEKGSVENTIRAPGEIAFNEDRVVHMAPRVTGIASKVLKRLGQSVKAGESMAVIESRELADAKSTYLATRARGELAEKSFAREKALHEKQVSPEKDYIEAEVTLSEARILLRSARQKLAALGLPSDQIEALGSETDEALTQFEVRAPIAGVVTEKHISRGESLQADAAIFTVADLSTVWVDLAISQEAIPSVRKGQAVTIRMPDGATAGSTILFVSPTVDSKSRTALARCELDNSSGKFRPGTFIEAVISIPSEKEAIVVPKASIQLVQDYPCVFVWSDGGFEVREVVTGVANNEKIEIQQGLEPGEKIAAVNAFHLKAEFIKAAAGDLGDHHGHSH